MAAPLDYRRDARYNPAMKLITRVQLRPDADAAAKLQATMETFNTAADFVAGVAFDQHTANQVDLRRLCYHEIRQRFGLSSQQAQLAIKAVCDAYKRDKSRRVHFRQHAALPFDQRIMGFKAGQRVSLLTLAGRVLVPYVVGDYGRDRLTLPKGQADLIRTSEGTWFLLVTVEVPAERPTAPQDFLGVDLGIANLATDSQGQRYSGADVETIRKKHNLQRQRLQRKGTRGAKKKLRRLGKKEARFRRHQNHVISKQIVRTAKRTDCGIALENLKGIRKRVTARGGDARNRLGGWGFAQLGGFIVYKAQLAGVMIEFVNPAYSSQTCAACGHRRRSNRKSQSEFCCKRCGHQAHADVNAARIHRSRALASLSRPQDCQAVMA
jgi:IS605 OrfB family transposase